MSQRNISIDILRFLAVMAIVNSHLGKLYGEYSSFATGGAIGNALFFFISGFSICIDRFQYFFNFYKRRISRIYPTVFSWALVCCLLHGTAPGILDVILYGGGWFVSCIMLYYVPFFFLRKYYSHRLKFVLVVFVVIVIPLYWLFNDVSAFNIFGDTYYKWFLYFIFMLQGAIMSNSYAHKLMTVRNGWAELLKAIACIVVFYTLFSFMHSDTYNVVQLTSLPALIGVVHFLFRLCSVDVISRLFTTTLLGTVMKIVGSLCLEIYLVHFVFLTDMYNNLFPLNILLYFLIVLCAAYLLRCLARIWSQTFKDAPYDWKAVFLWV